MTTRIPVTGAAGLRRAAARTRLVRAALVMLVLVAVLAATLAARHPGSSVQSSLPVRSGDVIVLDLSASISQDTYSRIGETLRQIVAKGGRYALVVFSGVAYEALPPGTPASALQPLIRYFTLPRQPAEGVAPAFPINPWSSSFSGGTAISAGLELARTILISSRQPHAAVVLVSDLADDPQDRNRLNQIVTAYRQEQTPLRVVPLNASPTDAAYFAHLTTTALGNAPAPSTAPAASSAGLATPDAQFPTELVVAAAATICLLAACELAAARVRWSPR